MSRRGYFLVLEGVEGAGKSTQARLLAEWLGELDLPFQLAREPGGTEVGESIRNLLLDARGLEIPPESELLMMLAARAAFVRKLVIPTLERGEVMVADRFELSTFAYQALGRGLDLEEVRRLNAFATGGVGPDLTMVLDLPASEGRERQRAAEKEADRIEGAGNDFLRRVGAGYRSLAERDDRVVLLSAIGSPKRVHERVRTLLRDRLPELFPPARG